MNEEEFIAKLKETAGLMQADGVEPDRIQQFIDQKKNEWSSRSVTEPEVVEKTEATVEETAPVVVEKLEDTGSQLEDTSLESPETIDDTELYVEPEYFKTGFEGVTAADAQAYLDKSYSDNPVESTVQPGLQGARSTPRARTNDELVMEHIASGNSGKIKEISDSVTDDVVFENILEDYKDLDNQTVARGAGMGSSNMVRESDGWDEKTRAKYDAWVSNGKNFEGKFGEAVKRGEEFTTAKENIKKNRLNTWAADLPAKEQDAYNAFNKSISSVQEKKEEYTNELINILTPQIAKINETREKLNSGELLLGQEALNNFELQENLVATRVEKLQRNIDSVLDFKEEVDYVSREYGFIQNSMQSAKMWGTTILSGAVDFVENFELPAGSATMGYGTKPIYEAREAAEEKEAEILETGTEAEKAAALAEKDNRSEFSKFLAEAVVEQQKDKELLFNKPMSLDELESFAQLRYAAGDVIEEQLPNLVAMAVMPQNVAVYGLGAMGLTSRQGEFAAEHERARQSNQELVKQYAETEDGFDRAKILGTIQENTEVINKSDAAKMGTSVLFGAAETLDMFGQYAMIKSITNAKRLLSPSKFTYLGTLSQANTFAKDALVNQVVEQTINVTQNIADVIFDGQDKSIFENAKQVAFSTLVMNSSLGGVKAASNASAIVNNVIASKEERLAEIVNFERQQQIKFDLKNTTDKSVRKILNQELKSLKERSVTARDITSANFLNLSEKEQRRVFELDRESRKIKKAYENAMLQEGITESSKDIIRESFIADFDKAQAEKRLILDSANKQKLPKGIEGATGTGDFLRAWNKNNVSKAGLRAYNIKHGFANKILGIDNDDFNALQEFVKDPNSGENITIDNTELTRAEATEIFDSQGKDEKGNFTEKGKFSAKSKNVWVFTDVAALDGDGAVFLHEYLHGYLNKKGISKDKFGEIYSNLLNSINNSKELTDEQKITVKAKLAQYESLGAKDTVLGEELFAFILDVTADDVLRSEQDKGYWTALGEQIKGLFTTDDGDMDLIDLTRFKTADDVKKFVNDFQRAISKDESISTTSVGPIEESADDNLSSKVGDPIIAKFFEGKKKGEISDADTFLVAQKFEIKAKSVANSIWNQGYNLEQGYTKEDFITDLIYGVGANSVRGLAKGFDPNVGSFEGWVNTYLKERAKAILTKRVGKQASQGAITIDSPESMQIASDEANFADADDIDTTSESLGVPNELIVNSENVARRALQKTENVLLNEKNLNKTQKETQNISATTFNRRFETELTKSINNFIGKDTKNSKKFTEFINKNASVLSRLVVEHMQSAKGTGVTSTWHIQPPSKQELVDYYTGKDLKVGMVTPKAPKGLTKEQISRAISTRKTKSLPSIIARQLAKESKVTLKAQDPKAVLDFENATKTVFSSKVLNKLPVNTINSIAGILNSGISLENYLNNGKNWASYFSELGITNLIKEEFAGKKNGETAAQKVIDSLVDEFDTAFKDLAENTKPTFTYQGKKYNIVEFIKDKILSEIGNESYKLSVEAFSGHALNTDLSDAAFVANIHKHLTNIGNIMGKEWFNRFMRAGLSAPSKIGNGQLKLVDGEFVFTEGNKGTNRFGLFENVDQVDNFINKMPPSKNNTWSVPPAEMTKPFHKWSKKAKADLDGTYAAIRKAGVEDNKAMKQLVEAMAGYVDGKKVKNGIKVPINETVAILQALSANPKGLGRTAGILDFVPEDTNKDYGQEGKYLLEHMTPALAMNLAALDFIHNKETNPQDYYDMLDRYRTAQLPKFYDDLVNEFYKDHMPFYFDPKTVSLVRYYNPEIGKAFDLRLKQISTGTIIDGNYFQDKAQQTKAKADDKAVFEEDTMSSKVLDADFNNMLERVKGIKAEAVYSEDRANKIASGKKGLKFFVPYSAEDFVGLIYPTLGKGKEGDRNLQWYKDNLLDPYAIAMSNFEKAKQEAMRDWADLKKRIKSTPAALGKDAVRGFSNEEAVRVYLWNEINAVPDTLAQKDVDALVKHIEGNKALKDFANNVKKILGEQGYPPPTGDWLAGTLTTDLINNVNTVKRAEFLQQWKDNVDVVYSKDNMNKLKAIYGERYTEALENILHRMETGRNRPGGGTRLENQWLDWVNNSVGTVMFFNTRSALLQTISSINFLNWSFNNPLMAAKAFANQPQFWKDFSSLFNSDFLKQRRSGLKNDVNADEIARAAASSTNKVKAAMAAILKAGFLPTQMADSFAIAIGGASFYRNRVNSLVKEGMTKEQAMEQAMIEFQETAEESQQSSRPDRVSMQQAGGLGRVVLAFANTPMQYTRLTKKAALDLINGRGDWKTNMSKLLYYGAVQNIIFTALQQAMFAMAFDDESDEDEKEAMAKIANGVADTLLRGTGVYGAAATTVKNIVLEAIKQQKSKRTDYTKAALKSLTLSPPIDTKVRKLMSAARAFTYKQSLKDMKTKGASVDNPAALAAGQVISAAANVPIDRFIIKARNIKGALDQQNETWQQIALALGYSEWQLGIEKDKSDEAKPIKYVNPRSKVRKGTTTKSRSRVRKPPTKRLDNGVAGVANRDGTIEVDPNLSPVEHEKTVAHEEQHVKDMASGKLDYDDKYVYWNDAKYARVNGKIKYKGKSYIEGHKSLPWEKKAYAAEPSTSAVKRKLY